MYGSKGGGRHVGSVDVTGTIGEGWTISWTCEEFIKSVTSWISCVNSDSRRVASSNRALSSNVGITATNSCISLNLWPIALSCGHKSSSSRDLRSVAVNPG